VGLRIFDLQLPIANWLYRETPIENRKLTIGNHSTHPLPRGGTDFMGPFVVNRHTIQTASQAEKATVFLSAGSSSIDRLLEDLN
jgi:hypothetical protein